MELLAFLFLLASILLWLISRKTRAQTGVPDGRVVYSDAGAWQRNEKPLFSNRYGLAGKPDYLVKDGSAIIPVELKTGAAPSYPRKGHILQLAAYCLLVEENFKARPAYGIIKYANSQFEIDFTPALEDELLDALEDMRDSCDDPDGAPRNHTDPRHCAHCGVRDACDQRLA
jgi:CRISPR-associated exonuclease Cas4